MIRKEKGSMSARREMIQESIRHWTDDYKQLYIFGGDKTFGQVFSSDSCACCRGYCSTGCGCKSECPVVEETGVSCNKSGAPWYKASCAYDIRDHEAFLAARKELIDALNRALVKDIERERSSAATVGTDRQFEVGKVYLFNRGDDIELLVFKVTAVYKQYIEFSIVYAADPTAWFEGRFFYASDLWNFAIPFYAVEDNTLETYKIVGIDKPAIGQQYIEVGGRFVFTLMSPDEVGPDYNGFRYIVEPIAQKVEPIDQKFEVGGVYLYRYDNYQGYAVFRVTDVINYTGASAGRPSGSDINVMIETLYAGRYCKPARIFVKGSMVWDKSIPFYDIKDKTIVKNYKIVGVAVPVPGQQYIGALAGEFVHKLYDLGEVNIGKYGGLRYIVEPVGVVPIEVRVSDTERRLTELERIIHGR